MRALLNVILLYLCLWALSFPQCGALQKSAPVPAAGAPLQGIRKQLPDGSQYIVIYSIPGFFPPDIPVYRKGDVQKIYVYHDRDMDIVIKTTDTLSDIASFYAEESARLAWKIERNNADPAADHRVIKLPLTYNDCAVETLRFFADSGRVLAAVRGGLVMVCRIIRVADTPYTFIIQQIRTGGKS